jgi:hypothetical protein
MIRTIRPMRQGMWLLLVVWAVGTGCTYDAAIRRLSPPEQTKFFHIPSFLVVTSCFLRYGLDISMRYPHRVSL